MELAQVFNGQTRYRFQVSLGPLPVRMTCRVAKLPERPRGNRACVVVRLPETGHQLPLQLGNFLIREHWIEQYVREQSKCQRKVLLKAPGRNDCLMPTGARAD